MRKVTINESDLLKIKENMVGSSKPTASRNAICVTEAAPEVDEYELGQESDNPPVGGNYCHVNEVKIPQNVIDVCVKYRPDKYHNWVVVNLLNLFMMPKYFQKRQTAYEEYTWMRNMERYAREHNLNDGRYKPVIINLDKIVSPITEGYGNVSINGDVNRIDYIDYIPHDNPREEGYDADNITDFTPYYEITCYGNDGEIILYGELTLNELFNYFPDKIIHAMTSRKGRKVSEAEWRIDDILSWDTKPNNIDDVDEVNAIAKRIQSSGPSSYILTDGDVISFPDHIHITTIDGMTPSKFVGLGNIRVGCGGAVELAKEPTRAQIYSLKEFLRGEDSEVYLDIVEDSGRMYPECICSAAYKNPNVDRIINDIIYYFQDGVRPQGNMQYESKRKYRKLIENINFEVDSSEIDLSSFKKKDRLPQIWEEDGKLDSRIRLKLLSIADDFWNFVNLTWVKPNGIILTGSICNFNWSSFSDIDLHLIVDFDEIDEKTEFVRDYLDAKKNEWNNEHSGLQIMGYPVELYVQNLEEIPQSGGIYDLEENDWIKKPNADDIKPIGLNKFSIKDKAANIMTIIDDMYDALNSTSDLYEIEQIGDDAKYLWKKVKNMRKKGLETQGESSSANIVYKILRRTNYLEKLWKLLTIVYDRSNSINESITHFDMFDAAKKMFGVTNDIRECGFILPDGTMLDFSGKHSTNNKASLEGRRTVDHRSIEKIGNENTPYITLSRFIEAGAIRCDVRGAFINLIKRPTKEQIAVLSRFILRCKGYVQLEIGNHDISLDYVEYEEGTPYRRIINDILNFFDNKIKPSSLYIVESKEVIKEYLDKDNNLSLYKYFQWFQNAGEREKLEDLMHDNSYVLSEYINNMSKKYDEFETYRMELVKNEDVVYDEEFIDGIIDTVIQLGLYNAYEYFFRNKVDYYEWPTWLEMDFIRIVKNEWCIHFTEYADDISKEGFTSGTEDISRLAFTGAGQQKPSAGYDFAFLINDRNVDFNNYGTKAVIFRTSGVLVRHYGDEQDQVIFWGPNVKSFITVENDGDWIVYGQKGQVLFRGEKPSDVAFWATNNLPQYRKQIMTGKNGYIPKIHRWNTETNRYEKVPYPIYRNESVKKYLTLLKEEVVADGNSEHNPYEKRWDTERKALKDFVSNYGKLMQSKENGKLYKCYYDKVISQLIGYNYCICIQWDSVEMKPKSVLYIRALDKFSPNIKQVQYDTRGYDNQMGTKDDITPKINYGNT